ncbi:MAG: FeoA family protein [Candidatus Nanopelagicales bacterium]
MAEHPLDDLATGTCARIVGFTGLSGATQRRLRHQGIVVGAEVTVERRTSGRGRVIAVGRSRIAVSRAICQGIRVTDDHDA